MKTSLIRDYLKKKPSGASIDIAVGAIILTLVLIASNHFDLFELLIDWSREYEDWQIDELVIAAIVMTLFFCAFVWRRRQELKYEFKRRRRLEDELRESNEINFSLIEQSPHPILISDLDGKAILANKALEKLSGFSASEILGKRHPRPWWTGQDPISQRARDRNAAMSRKGQKFEERFRKKNGELFWVELNPMAVIINGKPRFYMFMWADITERKKLEDELRESNEINFSLLEQSPHPILITDLDRRATRSNKALEKLTGYSASEIIGSKSSFPWWIDQNVERKTKRDKAAALAMENQKFEERFRKKNGELFWVEVTPIKVVIGGQIKLYMFMWADITERKKVEQEREKLLKEVKDKAKELEQIIYVTSHDLRSPLVNIQGFTKELEQSLTEVRSAMQNGDIPHAVGAKLSVPMNEDIPDALKYILASTSKIDTLLAGLLRLSRLGRAALSIEKLDMNKLITEIARTFEFRVKEAGVTLEVEHLPQCRGDQTQVNQVFSNLIDNALKFLDPDRPGIIIVSGREEGGQVTYCVEDNGTGIAPEHQEKVFEIFQRLEPDTSSGEGLGLTIVRRILDRHSGRIWLESERSKGSKFFVSLPVHDV